MEADRAEVPAVRVVVVNYDGGDMTMEYLAALERTEWPPERLKIVLVDNASRDGVADRVSSEMPDVDVM